MQIHEVLFRGWGRGGGGRSMVQSCAVEKDCKTWTWFHSMISTKCKLLKNKCQIHQLSPFQMMHSAKDFTRKNLYK